MRAPVYRNIEGQNTLLGLAFPVELLAFLGGCVAFIQLFHPLAALLAAAVLYVLIRVASHGRPPMFFQHWAAWTLRQIVASGRISAAARSSAPRFPYGSYQVRDLGPKRGNP
jgi:type IV secretory pathway VirB3-like protein